MTRYVKHTKAGTGFSRSRLQEEYLRYAWMIEKSVTFAGTLSTNYRDVSQKYLTNKLGALAKLTVITDNKQKEVW